jgi:hypothetical protein
VLRVALCPCLKADVLGSEETSEDSFAAHPTLKGTREIRSNA